MMAALSQAKREALHERIRAAVKADPAASARQIARRVRYDGANGHPSASAALGRSASRPRPGGRARRAASAIVPVRASDA